MPNLAVPVDAVSELAQLLKAAADDLRLSVLQALAQDSYGVLELAQGFGVRQSGMSHHLKVLANAGLVETRREGNSIFYRRVTLARGSPRAELIRALFASLDAQPLDQSYRSGLHRVWQERAQRSQQFFRDNATKFKAQQDLIASFDAYGAAVTSLLPAASAAALEVGPGEGDFLPVLSARFQRVLALDNSVIMLDKARSLTTRLALKNIEFRLGDTGSLHEDAVRFDCAVINMVLHHTPSPAQIFADVSNSLKAGGSVLVTELCSHDQTWAQEACGDLWLGFAPDDLQAWAVDSGLQAGQSVYLALRNGFQIQVRQFVKPIQDYSHPDQTQEK